MEGVVQIQFIFITLFIRDHTTSLLHDFLRGYKESTTSSSLEKQKALVKISPDSYLLMFHLKFVS